VYGGNVSYVSRTVNSNEFANNVQVLGTPPMFRRDWTGEAKYTVPPRGMWFYSDNRSDVNRQQTLNEISQGHIDRRSQLAAAYTIRLREGAYSFGSPNMGDVVRLIITKGRLDVDTTVRILGITYAINDDDGEDVGFDLGFHGAPITRADVAPTDAGSPPPDVVDRLEAQQTQIDALARRTRGAQLTARAHRSTSWTTFNDMRIGFNMVDPPASGAWGTGLDLGYFFAPVEGHYQVNACMGIVAGAAGETALGQICVNDAGRAYGNVAISAAPGNLLFALAADIVYCQANDRISYMMRGMVNGRTGLTGPSTFMSIALL
jgi:hypothetical protein